VTVSDPGGGGGPLRSDLVADPDLRARLRRAEAVCLEAGDLLLSDFENREAAQVDPEYKGRRELVTASDRASEERIVESLRREFPEDAFLAEEGVASEAGEIDGEGRYCWVLDPLDGTTNFVHGHPHWAVSLGLLEEGRPVLGLVHAPALGRGGKGEFWVGIPGLGAWRGGRPIRVSRCTDLEKAVVATGFSYDRNESGVNPNLGNFERMFWIVRGIRRCGSAAIDLAMTASGIYDLFWELHLRPYDVAAGIALVLAAGGEVRDLGSGDGALFGGEILAGSSPLLERAAPLLKGRAEERNP